MKTKKYRFTGETIEYNSITLHRIQALVDFFEVKAGDLGGWIEKEENLSQEGDCWIYGDAMVFGDNEIVEDIMVFDINYINKAIREMLCGNNDHKLV